MAKKSGDETLDRMYDIVNGPDDNVIDPIAYRSDYRPEDINPKYTGDPNIPGVGPQGANEHFNEYGDDSNTQWQSVKGGRNEKYTGEGVKTSELDYDPNVTTAGLDPNYTFGNEVKTSKTKEAGYLAKRNDMIASALYNEGKVSREDVANYLSAQKGWFNSTEADRQNTIEAIWKRIGQMSPKEEQKQEGQEGDYGIVKDNSGTIYGKTSAEEGNPKEGINTLSDANSPYTIMEESRVANLNELASMSNENIAMSLNEGINPANLQALRDFQSQFPERWAEVQQYQKKLKAQNTVTSIANGTEINTDNNGQSVVNNSIADFANKNAGSIKTSQEITADVNDSLAQNQTAQAASETMASIEEDMAILKNRLKNIRAEANSKFKGDVPDYLVNAYIANKTQEIQNQMSILEDRYNAAYNRYKNEVANTQWEKEYQLKEKELALKEKYYNLEKWQAEQGTSSSTKKDSTNSTVTDDNGNQIAVMNDEDIAAIMDGLLEDFDYLRLGNAQCAAGIQKYYFTKLGITIGNLSSFERKKSLINEKKGYVPKKGDLIILSSKTAPENGHIGIVIGVTSDGYVQYLDWNGSIGKDGKGTEKPAINSMPMDSAKIQGYRNINKGQDGIYESETETSTQERSDSDYAAFEKFLDSKTSATDRKQLAEEFGMDVKTMRETAEKALADRNKTNPESNVDIESETEEGTYSTENGRTVLTKPDGTKVVYAKGVSANDARLNEEGFDPALGFNPNMKDIYEKVLLNTDKDDSGNWLANREEFHQREKGQLWQEANAYANAKKEGYDAYTDELREVDKTYGFAVNKKDVYEDMNKAKAKDGKIPATAQKGFIERLGLNVKDPNSWEKASDELANYNKRSKEVVSDMDSDLNDLIWSYEYIIMQDATKPQRNSWIDIGEKDTWEKAYELVTGNEIFEKLINTKSQGGTLTPVSDRDMEMIKKASTAIDKKMDSDSFRDRVNSAYKALRESIGNPITDEELNNMWNMESKSKKDFSDYLVINHSHRTGLFGGKNKYSSKKTEEEIDKKAEANPWTNGGVSTGATAGSGIAIIDPDEF